MAAVAGTLLVVVLSWQIILHADLGRVQTAAQE